MLLGNFKYLLWAAKKQSKEAILRIMDVAFIQSPLLTLQERNHFWRNQGMQMYELWFQTHSQML